MPKNNYTHVAFADESNWNQGRFRSIALVSSSVIDAREFHKELDALRQKHGKNEFKWAKTCRRHGIDLVDFVFQRCDRLRIDTIIWDIEDSRHKGIRDRDDRSNFARMYYHLLHSVMKFRWPADCKWLICPDEQKEVDWQTLESCLGWKSWAIEENLFTRDEGMAAFMAYYSIEEVRQSRSNDIFLIQLADMFAGIAAYSYTAFEKYLRWKEEQNATPSFLTLQDCGAAEINLSHNDKERLPIIHHVRIEAGARKFQVSLNSSNGLCTKNPKNPLNFWLYVPQRVEDKAPIRHHENK